MSRNRVCLLTLPSATMVRKHRKNTVSVAVRVLNSHLQQEPLFEIRFEFERMQLRLNKAILDQNATANCILHLDSRRSYFLNGTLQLN